MLVTRALFLLYSYFVKVIDETLRLVNISFVAFRQATSDVDING